MTSQKRHLLFEKQAQIIKAVAQPLRLGIIDFLKAGPRCVCDIAEHLGAERSNVSRHLSVLVSAGILEYRKEGQKAIYHLKTPCVLDFVACVKKCLKQQAKDNQKLLKAL